MPITRKFVAQNQEECQILNMDAVDRFIVNQGHEWQFLFGPASVLSNSDLVIKMAARFNSETFDGIKVIAYLYEAASGSISNAASATFDVYKVSTTTWEDEFINTFPSLQLPNSYYYRELTEADLGGIALDGENTLMIEVVVTRLSDVYRDRIYINHLGVYDSVIRLRKDVDFLNITKQDL